MWKAHRVAFVLAGRTLEPGEVVRHLCNTPGCVNPQHLAAGTQRQNIADRLGYSLTLTREQVEAIRGDPRPNVEIASEYGISQPSVSLIKSGARWPSFA